MCGLSNSESCLIRLTHCGVWSVSLYMLSCPYNSESCLVCQTLCDVFNSSDYGLPLTLISILFDQCKVASFSVHTALSKVSCQITT